MATFADVMTAVKATRELAEQTAAKVDKIESTPVHKAFGVPNIREGEDPMTSRPFYVSRAAAVVIGAADENTAKYETEFSNKLKKAMTDAWGASGTKYTPRSILVPLSWDLMPDDVRRDSAFTPYRKAFDAAMQGLDPEQTDGRRMVDVFSVRERGVIKKAAMSALNQTTGGALVAPAQFGDLVTILRNKAVMQNIGAKQVPLPAQGSMEFPRQTGVSTSAQVPENTAGTESNPTYDTITMSPKQFIGLVRVANQLLAYAPGLAESSIREDMGEQAALTFDLACLEGVGGPNKIRGLINQTGIATVVAKVTGANGNTWSPVDTARLIKANMNRNSDVKTFVMRPDMWLGITETRASGPVAGDGQGPYLYEMLRQFSTDFGTNLRQRDVVTSNQISTARTKGSGTALTYILGVDGQEIMVGMHGAMVLDANPYESTAFNSNQTLMRSIMFGDMAVRRPAGIAFMDTLIVPNLDS